MYARVTTGTVQSDKVDETTRTYNASILPAVKAANGNRGVFLLIDPASGKALSITFWNTEADGRAYDTSGTYREQVAKISAFFAAAPTLATYEATAQG